MAAKKADSDSIKFRTDVKQEDKEAFKEIFSGERKTDLIPLIRNMMA